MLEGFRKTAVQAGRWRVAVAAGLVAGCAALAPPGTAQTAELDAPFEVVEFGPSDTLRELVATYLRDPDLWPVVLAVNGISSPAELVPGVELSLPVQQVRAVDSALLAALQAIQQATAEGARIFAPGEIGSAVESRDGAISQRQTGAWSDAVDLAARATGFAQEALEISIAQRDRSAEAVVSDVQGDVEGRAPEEPAWSDRDLNDVLVEFERLRTLSNSTAQITFRDLSRLRLNPNSNATIQRMRSDPLTGGEVTKVSLVNGDFYALLNQLSDRTSFEIDVPGIETTTNSADFWIKNDDTGARFANYDAEALQIMRGDEMIELGENEGAVLGSGGAQIAAVLDRPQLVSPGEDAVVFERVAALGWEAFPDAEAYWLEVASDPGFNQMQTSEWGIRQTGFELGGLGPGTYHWRVAALDRLGLPGAWSVARSFTLRIDETPPFLTLLSPRDNTIATTPRVELLGASEPDARLALNDAPLEVAPDGSFIAVLDLVPGENRFVVTAVDPAGNASERQVSVVYRPAAAVEIELSEAIPRAGEALATRSRELSVSGTTDAAAGAPIVVRDAGGSVVVQARVEEGGAFSFTVASDLAARAYRMEILAPGGAVEGALEFGAVTDTTAPEVTLDLPPPLATAQPLLELTGQAGDAVALAVDDTPVPLEGGAFALSLALEPGPNQFDLLATDAVGNVSATRLQTLYDIAPPEILSVEARRPQGTGGPIEILLEARDDSGLRQAAPFVIAIGAAERDGFLRCDPTSGICRATLPPEPGELRIIEVIVEDYAGNEAIR